MLGGLLIAAGVVFVVRALRPAAPSLAAALEQLSADPTTTAMSTPATAGAGRWEWLPAPMTALLNGHLGVSDADLAIIGWTRSQLAARKLSLAAADRSRAVLGVPGRVGRRRRRDRLVPALAGSSRARIEGPGGVPYESRVLPDPRRR